MMLIAPEPQNLSRSGSPCVRLSPAMKSALKSSTHSHTRPCMSLTPYLLVAPPTGGSCAVAGRSYHARMRRRQAGSARASLRVSSAAAAYSHSIHVGRRAPSLSQNALAANQLTLTTGADRRVSLAGCVGAAQDER